MWAAKAEFRDELGRKREADAVRLRYEGVAPAILHAEIYQQFNLRLDEFRVMKISK